ncbi:MAG: fructose 1,6-bisphosphatase [Microbacterium sp. SCN 70-200]|uniref:fructose 1,6-bisphosphatase n=1 Tax=unclassified Microbacterium TaxID=2609290 RepID=UPI00086F8D51|nr:MULTISPECIES: fructose 1,6-bisphosphatase [unclassified Microbacterium]MBN9216102.1 fructose 1,6-bisphosphatase [Microbacterium sp.]ODT39840.1 MAG: fructose 1,6-bisphosphatase [Microbacterium sp. SCN 70-200]OJV80579.1 MAG: fructose 1,6-bisphosphatase [Microbacterium sp. 70-16]
MRSSLRRVRLLAATGALVLATSVSLTGCAQVVDAFNNLQNDTVATPAPNPTASTVEMAYDSQFTYDGSVSLSYEVAEDLEVRVDVWAADPKRTSEWTPDAEKTFGFAVNVYDHRVDEKAVLTQKRRVYLSLVSITSQLSQSGLVQNQLQSPFQFSADPRTLVPTDTLRSDRGLLLNSFQGGLLVPETTIHQLPADTYGITLQFALQVWVEGAADDDSSFSQQTVYQVLPIAIFSPDAATQ